jgi:cytosine/adenosine deaminase-related metal-dependent hydrolase
MGVFRPPLDGLESGVAASRLLVRGGLVITGPESGPSTTDVLVEGDRIARVGPDLPVAPDTTVLDARDRLVIPGLVNAHTHAHNNIARGAIGALPLELWLLHLKARVERLGPRDVYVMTALGALEMLRTGTTTACDMAQTGPWPSDEMIDAVAQAYVDVGLRASIAPQFGDLPFHHGVAGLAELLPADVRREIEGRPGFPRAEALGALRRAIDRWDGAAGGRLRLGLGPSIATVCSDELLRECAELARERQVPLQIHLSETKAEAYTAGIAHGKSSAARLAELGVLTPRTLLAHAVWLDERDLDLVAGAGSSVAHNPVSNLRLGAGIAPLRGLRARGVNVGLGTDGAASNDNQNLFGALKLAAILPRIVTPDHDAWPGAADAFRMATVNGARAAGFDGRTGTIAPGMQADLVLLDLRATYYHPRNDVLAQLVYSEVGSSVTTVLVAGRLVLDAGRVTTVDERALLEEANAVGQRIARESAAAEPSIRQLGVSVREACSRASVAELSIDRYATAAHSPLPRRGRGSG